MLNDQMPLIPQGPSTARCAVPASPDNPSMATSSNRQPNTTKPELQNMLQIPARNRQLTKAAVRTKVFACCYMTSYKATDHAVIRHLTWAVNAL